MDTSKMESLENLKARSLNELKGLVTVSFHPITNSCREFHVCSESTKFFFTCMSLV